MYQRRLAHQDNEQTQWKQFGTHLQRLLIQAKNEIHNEIVTRSSCEQTNKQLRVDILRLREQQQQKLKDLKQSSYVLGPNSTNERAHTFKSELSNAIRRIRQDFENQNDLHRNELYAQFTQSYDQVAQQYPEFGHLGLNEREQERIKQEEERVRSEIQRIRADSHLLKQKNSDLRTRIREIEINLQMSAEENKRIQQLQENQINHVKLKHDKTTKDYEDVISKQISLEKEIETYRNLLEGTMKPVIDHITDEFNSKTANQAKIEQKNNSSNLKTRSASFDRLLSSPYLANTNDDNSYVSCMTLNFNDNQPTSIIDIPITTIENDLEKSNRVENNDTDLNILETNEAPSDSPSSPRPPHIRPSIILQTRRNS
jgi:predicted DNA-binding transcriptional regulator